MMSGHSLYHLQRWMLEAICKPATASELRIAEALLPSRQQSAAERLAAYQHAYVARLLEVLREQFPCTRFAAGDDVFDQLALGYLQAHPPRSYTLARLADYFADHLEATRPADWGAFLVELARLEQAIERVFDGPGPEGLSTRQATFLRQEPLTEKAQFEAESSCTITSDADTGKMPVPPGEKAQFEAESSCTITSDADTGKMPVPPGDGSLKLSFVPGFELPAFRYPASAFYTAWKAGQEPAWPEAEEQFAALFRRDYIVRRFELTRAQYALLEGLLEGKSLGEALAAAAESAPDAALDQLALDVREWFSQWTASGFFVAVE
jgi:hypothetical protein